MTRDQTGGLPLWIPVHGFSFGYGFGVATRPGTDSGRPRRHLQLGWDLLHRLLGQPQSTR